MSSKVVSTSDLDFEGILANLRTYLKGQERLNDYDFDGANISVLLEVLAQNSYLMAYYLNMIGTEAWLDSAVLRESLVSRSKELNYTPRSRTSARAVVDIEITPTDTPYQITIPKNYAVRSTIGAKTTTFLTNQNTVITANNGSYIASDVTVYEGVLVTEYFNVASVIDTGYYTYTSNFTCGSNDIDSSSIEVFVMLPGETVYTQFERADSLFGLTTTSEVFFVQASGASKYEVVLGDGVMGKGIVTGSKIKVTYRDTLGSTGNGLFAFTKSTSIDGYNAIDIITTQVAYGGSERESTESIRFNAPRHFQTQYRAVVPSDYETLIRENFPEIQAVSAYGGEKVKKYGKVIIAVKPSGLYSTVPDSLKNRMKAFLLTKNITTEPVFVEPEYFWLEVNSKVYFDLNLITENTSTIKASTVNALTGLNDTMFTRFGVNVRPSRIETAIDAVDTSITGNDTTYRMIKKLIPVVNEINSITIDFGNELYSDVITTEYPIGHKTGIASNDFGILVDDSPVTVHILDDGAGRLYYYRNLGPSSPHVKFGTQIGSVDYTTGIVTLDITPYSYSSTVNIYATPANRDLTIEDNMYVSIDGEDITITMMVDNG